MNLETFVQFNYEEANFISKEKAKELVPYLNLQDILTVLHLPGDGTITSSDACQAYSSGAKQNGAKIFEKCEVLGVIDHDNGTAGYTVQTSMYLHFQHFFLGTISI